MIKELIIKGLYNKYDFLEFAFNDDLNLLTGLNGCGKTTLLKTLWFINSGPLNGILQNRTARHASCST